LLAYQRLVTQMVRAFTQIPIDHRRRVPRVGIVGEILVKFHPDANHHLVDYLQNKGIEVCLPDLTDFFLYTAHESDFNHQHLGGSATKKYQSQLTRQVIELYRAPVRRALARDGRQRFGSPVKIEHLAELAAPTISLGMCSGEGWFLTAEIIELIENNYPNVLCLQPFACLPNHIVGRGMLGALRERFKGVNLAALDYDPGTSEVANHNRIELFLANAWKNLASQKNQPNN
jgi:predicted nucleotide-binding protein (sugar kinase/HSP70/actin superfamily)